MPHNTPINASQIPVHTAKSLYPAPFAALVQHRSKRMLGDHFGLSHFGVNLTTLAPGAISAIKHHHAKQGAGKVTALTVRPSQIRPPQPAAAQHQIGERQAEEVPLIQQTLPQRQGRSQGRHRPGHPAQVAASKLTVDKLAALEHPPRHPMASLRSSG